MQSEANRSHPLGGQPPHRAGASASTPSGAEDYFGRGYYHLYRNYLLPPEQTEAEVAFLLRQLRPRRGHRWLDMPCGFGRHLLALKAHRPSLKLYGADRNLPYLGERGLREAAAIVQCDMRRPPYASGRFDAILNLLNSFGYYPPSGPWGNNWLDDRGVIAEWARLLRPGGGLVMDLPNRRALVTLVNKQPRVRYAAAGFDVTESFQWDPVSQCMRNKTQWKWPGGREESGYRIRLYTPTQIQAMLARYGFEITSFLGNFRDEPFDPWRSDRMLIVARSLKGTPA
jgi:SAM-dependent methyltransferase